MANSLDFTLKLLADTAGFNGGMDAAKKAATALAGALAAIGLGLSAKEIIDIADATQQMASRLKNATDSTAEYSLVQERLLKLANSTYRPLQEAQEVYLATAGTMKSLGYSTEQILAVTESLSLSFTHNATRADQAQAAQDALSKSMAKGAVDADAWMSIITGADNVVRDMAASTGRTEEEIRSLGANGKISINELTDALIKSRDRNQELADAMSTSTADGIQYLKNNVTALIGSLNEQYDVTGQLSSVLVTMGDNLDWLGVLFEDAIGAVNAWADSFDMIDPSIFDALKQSLSVAYDLIKEVIATAFELGKTIDEMFFTAFESLGIMVGGVDDAGNSFNGLTLIIQALNIAFGFVADGIYAARIGIKVLAAGFYEFGAATAKIMSIVTAAFPELSARFAAQSAQLKEASKKSLGEADQLAMDFESKGVQRAKEVSMTKEQINQKELVDAKAKYDELEKLENVSSGKKLKAAQDWAEAAIKASNGVLTEQTKNELAAKGYAVAVDEAGKVAVIAMANAATATDEAAKKAEAIKVATDNLKKADEDYLTFQKQAAVERALLEKQIEEAKRTGNLNALKVAQDSLAQINQREVELAKAREQRTIELDRATTGSSNNMSAASRAASEAAKALGLDIERAATGISKTFTDAKDNVTKVADGLKGMGYEGEQASQVLFTALNGLLSKAKTKEEVDQVKQAFIDFGDKGQLSTQQVEAGMQAIRQVVQKLPADLDPVEQAFERLGIKTKEQLALAAQSAMADFNTITASGKATAADIEKAYQRVIQAAIASGDQSVISQAKAQAAMGGLTVEIDKTGKAVTQTFEEFAFGADKAVKATDRVSGGFDRAGNSGVRAAQTVQEAWDNTVTSISKAAAKLDEITRKSGQLTGKDFLGESGSSAGTNTGDLNKALNGLNLQAYSEDQIKQKLMQDVGYDEQRARLKAKQLASDTSWAARSFGFSDVPGQLNRGELTNYNYVNEQIEKLSKITDATMSNLPDNKSEKTVNVNLKLDGKTVPVRVPAGQEQNLLDMLKQAKWVY